MYRLRIFPESIDVFKQSVLRATIEPFSSAEIFQSIFQ